MKSRDGKIQREEKSRREKSSREKIREEKKSQKKEDAGARKGIGKSRDTGIWIARRRRRVRRRRQRRRRRRRRTALIEGSLELELPTIWTVEKQR